MTEIEFKERLIEVLGKACNLEVVNRLYEQSLSLMEDAEITMTDTQKLGLASHLAAMVNREFEGGEIPEVQPEMFAEVSDVALKAAEVICKELPSIEYGEKYLLSIHFENARISS